THLARLLAGLLARAAGLLGRGRTRTRRRLARPPPGRAQTCARADESACTVRSEGRARTCSDEGAAQLRRPGGGCAWRGPPLRSRVELHHRALSAPASRGVVPRGTAQGSGAGAPSIELPDMERAGAPSIELPDRERAGAPSIELPRTNASALAHELAPCCSPDTSSPLVP